jgi:hypothetical protein
LPSANLGLKNLRQFGGRGAGDRIGAARIRGKLFGAGLGQGAGDGGRFLRILGRQQRMGGIGAALEQVTRSGHVQLGKLLGGLEHGAAESLDGVDLGLLQFEQLVRVGDMVVSGVCGCWRELVRVALHKPKYMLRRTKVNRSTQKKPHSSLTRSHEILDIYNLLSNS